MRRLLPGRPHGRSDLKPASQLLLGEPLFEDGPGVEASGQFQDVTQNGSRIDVGPGVKAGSISSGFDARKAGFLELPQGLIEIVHADVSQVVNALAALVQEIAVDPLPLERLEQLHHQLPHHGESGLEAVLDRLPLPLGRTASAEEIAGIIVYMLSEATSYMHGSIVWADGGMDAEIRPDAF